MDKRLNGKRPKVRKAQSELVRITKIHSGRKPRNEPPSIEEGIIDSWDEGMADDASTWDRDEEVW